MRFDEGNIGDGARRVARDRSAPESSREAAEAGRGARGALPTPAHDPNVTDAQSPRLSTAAHAFRPAPAAINAQGCETSRTGTGRAPAPPWATELLARAELLLRSRALRFAGEHPHAIAGVVVEHPRGLDVRVGTRPSLAVGVRAVPGLERAGDAILARVAPNAVRVLLVSGSGRWAIADVPGLVGRAAEEGRCRA